MRTLAAALALAVTGCSLLAVHGPGDTTHPGPIECTTSRAWPITDLVWAGVMAAAGAGALAEGASGRSRHGTVEAALGMGAMSLLFVISSLVGFGRIDECRDALAGP